MCVNTCVSTHTHIHSLEHFSTSDIQGSLGQVKLFQGVLVSGAGRDTYFWFLCKVTQSKGRCAPVCLRLDQEVACLTFPQKHWPELHPRINLVAREMGKCRKRIYRAKASCCSGGEVAIPETMNILHIFPFGHLDVYTQLSSRICPVPKRDSHQSLSLG